MKHLANSWIHGLAPYEAGRPIEEVAREFGFNDIDEIVKIASNENALGPSPKAIDAMLKASRKMHLYPDSACFYLRQGLAKRLGVHMDELLVGNGSNELIEFMSHVFLEKGANIVVASDAFVIYKLVASVFRAETISVPSKNFTHDLDAMRAAITPKTRLVYLGNPNNPTGTMVNGAAIDRFIEQVPEHVVVVLDEAYIELLPKEKQPNTLHYVKQGRKLYILRTFSKIYGLAGLRVGYAIAPKEGIELLHRVRQPFNVNAMGQIAALAALEDDEFVKKTQSMVAEGLDYLGQSFEELGLFYVPSVTNFILVKVGKGRQVFQELQRRKVIVRPMDAYGLPEYVRATVGLQRENERFIHALGAVLKRSEKL